MSSPTYTPEEAAFAERYARGHVAPDFAYFTQHDYAELSEGF